MNPGCLKIELIIGNIRTELNTKQFGSNIEPRKIKFVPILYFDTQFLL